MNEKELKRNIDYYFNCYDERETKKKNDEKRKKKEKEVKQILYFTLSGIICLMFLYYAYNSLGRWF